MISPGLQGMELPSVQAAEAAKIHVANMMRLCKDLRLPVVHKVYEEGFQAGEIKDPAVDVQPPARKFLIIVHVQSDFAFKKYLDFCSISDLMLYRGLLLEVTTTPDTAEALTASVRQAFLPKFEIEDKDTSVANCIVDQASERFMVVTIKHSGSLVTLSGHGFAAKNSVNNSFTAGASVLMQAHYDRVFGSEQGPARLASLMALLRTRNMAMSFEMVTGSHGHHGQLPAAEYLVATAAHTLDADTGKPVFLTWLEFLRFCIDQHLPVNDTWLMAGREWAAAARDVLDYLALNGGVTAPAIAQLNRLAEDGASAGCLHLPGTYPHHQWQGSRLEGFVVAQGQQVDADTLQALGQLRTAMTAKVLPLQRVPVPLRTPYQASLRAAAAAAAGGGGAEDGCGANLQPPPQPQQPGAVTQLVCALRLAPVEREVGQRVVDAVMGVQAPGILVRTPNGSVMACRSALGGSGSSLDAVRAQLQQLSLYAQAADGAGSGPGGASAAAVDPEGLRGILHSILAGAGDTPDAEGSLAQKAYAAVAVCDAPGVRQALARLPRALIGAPSIASTLRYKKKMLLWLAPTRPATKRKAAELDGAAESLSSGTEGSDSKRSKQGAGGSGLAHMTSAAAAVAAEGSGGGGTAANSTAAADVSSAPGNKDGRPGAKQQDVEGMQREQSSWQPPAAAGGPPGEAGAGNEGVTSSDLATAAAEQSAQGGVGYCMLTFIIRNGLQALKLGLSTYLTYCDTQAEKLGLGKKQRGQVNMFARTWARWIDERGGPSVVDPWSYLHYAEPFVQEFLEQLAAGKAGGGMLGGERPKGAFQGFLVLVDVPKPKALALKDALGAAHLLEATELPPFSKALACQGSLVWMPPGSPVPKPAVLTAFFAPAGGGRQVFVYVEPLSPDLESSNAPEAKKVKGMRTGKLRAMENLIKGPKEQPAGKGKKPLPQQQQQQQDASQQLQAAEQQWQSRVLCIPVEKSVEEIVLWVGPGVPSPPADPAAIICFVSIPATGKSAIASSLQPPAVADASQVQLRVLNSDSMKSKGAPANRFWHDVAAAADSHLGGHACIAVIADKNLVPSPRDNVERSASVLNDSGAVAAAVLPVCAGTSSATMRPELYAGLPPLPFPLELVALCMLRTLTREDHVGKLDAKAPDQLAVMASFATYFKGFTHKGLLQYLRGHFPVVTELPVMEAADHDPQRQVPVEVLQHIAHGLELACTERLGNELSPGMQEWQRKARSLLQQPDVVQRLLGLQRPLEACCWDLQRIVGTALQHARQPSEVEGEQGVLWVAVTGFESDGLRAAARQALPAEMHAQMKDELHITLWHCADPAHGSDAELQQGLVEAVGSEVAFEVTHIDYVPHGMAAAKVQLTSGPEAALGKLSGCYMHITLVVGPSGRAKDAGLLETAVLQQSWEAHRHALAEPLQLVGRILAVQE